MSNTETSSNRAAINVDEVTQLVNTLQADLEKLKTGSQSVDVLRREVDALRAALGAQQTEDVPEHLQNVHGKLASAVDTLEFDAFKTADYVARIGRILGLS